MAGPGRFSSEFRANSERTPSSEQVPGKFRASIPSPLYFFVILCSKSPRLGWLTTGNASAFGAKLTMRGTQQVPPSSRSLNLLP